MEPNGSNPQLGNASHPKELFAGLELLLHFKLLFIPLYCLLVAVACLGNAFLMGCIAADKKLHNTTNVFLGNLSLGDLLMCLTCVPLTASYAFEVRGWLFGRAMCHAVALLQAATVYVSVLSLTAIAVDRYVVVAYPMRQRITLHHCSLVVAAIWALALALAAPLSWHTSYVDLRPIGHDLIICEEFWKHMESHRLAYACAMLLISYLVPLLAVTISYCSISAHLRRRSLPGLANPSQARWAQNNHKTFRLLVVSVLVFALCWLPLQVLNLIWDLDPDFTILGKRYINLAQVSCHVAAMSSACYNPFIYASLHRKCRTKLRSYFWQRQHNGRCAHTNTCLGLMPEATAVGRGNEACRSNAI